MEVHVDILYLAEQIKKLVTTDDLPKPDSLFESTSYLGYHIAKTKGHVEYLTKSLKALEERLEIAKAAHQKLTEKLDT